MTDKVWHTVTASDDVTEEILNAAESIHEGWYANESRVDWENFLDRLEGMELADGTYLDLGDSLDSPAIRKIKSHIRAIRKADC